MFSSYSNPAVARNFKRSSATGPSTSLATSSSGSRDRRMNWLVNQLQALGASNDFSESSREWVRNRVANSEIGARERRSNSVFWEHTANETASPVMKTLGVANPFLYGGGNLSSSTKGRGHKSVRSAGSNPASQSRSGSVGSSSGSNAPRKQIPLEEVLQDEELRGIFLDYLEENETNQAMEFLIQVQKWKEKHFKINESLIELGDEIKKVKEEKENGGKSSNAAAGGDKGKFNVKLLMARKVYSRYLSESSEESISCDTQTRVDVRNALGLTEADDKKKKNVPEGEAEFQGDSDGGNGDSSDEDGGAKRKGKGTKNMGTLPNIDVSHHVFLPACAHAMAVIKDNWNSFIESEDYAAMVEDRRVDESEQKENAAAAAAQPQAKQSSAALVPPPPASPPPGDSYLDEPVSPAPPGVGSASSSSSALSTATASAVTFSLAALPAEADNQNFASGGIFGGTKPIGWVNLEEYKSLSIDILDIRGKKKDLKVCFWVSVDSKTLRTPSIESGPISEHIEFELLNTTLMLEISAWASFGRFQGFIAIPVAKIHKAQALAASSGTPSPFSEPHWVKLLPQPGSNAQIETEIQVKFTLSTSAPGDMGKYTQIYEGENQNNALADKIRSKVSKKKLRWQQDSFNLDLSYITDRIIAMGYPSEGSEGVYRNHMKNVQRFFHRRHPKSFRLYNLCSERSYEAAKFDGNVCCVPHDDHNPAAFQQIIGFCEDVRQWLSSHPQNVAAIHCKAGKGRTGTMIACYLLYINACKTAEAALEVFGERRTRNKKGVTIPSQMRYVGYFQRYCELKRLGLPSPGPVTLFLHMVVLNTIPKAAAGSEEDIYFTVTQTGKSESWNSMKYITPQYDKEKKSVVFDVSKKMFSIHEDVKFEFAVKTALGKEKLFQCWMNTRYQDLSILPSNDPFPRVIFEKRVLDKACKDTKDKKFNSEFKVEFIFAPSPIVPVKAKELYVNPVELETYLHQRDSQSEVDAMIYRQEYPGGSGSGTGTGNGLPAPSSGSSAPGSMPKIEEVPPPPHS